MKKLQFGVHWLVLGALVTAESLTAGLKIARKHRVTILELPWKPLMQIPHHLLAEILHKFGIEAVAICCFFGKGHLDPLNKRYRQPVLNELEDAAKFARGLRAHGIKVLGITGPWSFQIGKKYWHNDTRKRVISFCKAVLKIAATHDVPFFLECLRKEENTAIQGSWDLLDILRAVDAPKHIRGHLDTFHMNRERENISTVLAHFGPWLGWLHGSGTERRTPGAPGDDTCWPIIRQGLGFNRSNGGNVPCICFEGFSPTFRAMVPEIGGEFPRDLPPGKAITQARQTFRKARIT